MADDQQDLFDDIPEDEFEEDYNEYEEEPEPEVPDGPVEPDAAGYVKEAISELREMGIDLPDHVESADELAKLLCTALKTHKATKAMVETDTEGFDQGYTATPPTVEESPAMLSGARLKKECEVNPYLSRLCESEAKSRKKWRMKVLDLATKSGKIPGHRLSLLRQKAGQINLSLVGHKAQLEPIDHELRGIMCMLKSDPKVSELLKMSTQAYTPRSPMAGEVEEQEAYAAKITSK